MKINGQETMKYKISITTGFFNKVLQGEFESENRQQAVNECREFYAQELGTFEEDIQILEIKEL